ncbi:uncharacterized protein LOC111694124 [Trichogramma pretiosum]|uniref:uncharacterized protein LOC111694124 n=1 Tax=Trichogramma pretiosum TaxID=7493 RepID=UPI000C71A205|nr:uncharacterized protein LOC111694124 [Trichogramma pretiosum]
MDLLKILRNLAPNVNWIIEEERNEFFIQVLDLCGYRKDHYYFSSIFHQQEVDFLLIQAAITNYYEGLEFIQFLARTGYKDRIDVPKDGNNPLLLRRTTAVHHAARYKPYDWECMVEDLFKIFDRFDVNYVDALGLTHFHVACMACMCGDVVRKFLERGRVDPNLVWPETGDSPLHLSVRHGGNESVKILLRNGADPNLANEDGFTPLHTSAKLIWNHGTKLTFDALFCEDRKHPLRLDARDNLGDTPLHLALKHRHMEVAEVLLREGASPNLPNDEGHTPLHIICQSDDRYTLLFVDRGEAETFLKVTEELNQPVQVDARDKLGRTPLQLAVANLRPHAVESLLDRGADLSSFVLLPEEDFTTRFDPNKDDLSYFKLGIISSGALAVFESLEKRGYKVEDYVLIIMKIFSRLGLFQSSVSFKTHWYDDKKFATEAKRIQILPRISRGDYNDFSEFERAKIETAMTPSLSFYDLIRLRPEEAAKILTYRDYYDLERSIELPWLPGIYYEDVILYLYEKVMRGFCRRWALKYFYDLIRYRLSILCCEKIIDQLTNEDLCNICFAATDQDQYSFSFLQPSVVTMKVD